MRAAWLMLCLALPCAAQDFPSRSFRIIVPNAPGVGSDALARAAGQHLGAKFGQPFVVDNRVGAEGRIGMEACAKSAPDGYTICSGASNYLTSNLVMRLDLPYDGRSFDPLVHLGWFDSALAVNPALPASTLQEFVELAGRKAESITWGTFDSSGSGSLYMRWLQRFRNAPVLHVPYKTPPQMLTALVTGEIHSGIYALAAMQPQVKSGKLRLLAVTSAERHPLAPDTPTFGELGIRLPLRSWYGMVVPAGTPGEIVQRLNREINALIADADFRSKYMTSNGVTPAGGSAADFGAFLAKDREAFAALVKSLGVKPH
jgi:tripartite-type tricarboxylate transporter receptor subunit TctC